MGSTQRQLQGIHTSLPDQEYKAKKGLPSEGKTCLHNGYGSTLLKSTERLYMPTTRIQKPLNVSKGDLSVILESRTRMCLSFSKLY